VASKVKKKIKIKKIHTALQGGATTISSKKAIIFK